jgi:hypothetical protein
LTIKHTTARKGKGPPGGAKAGPPGSDLERKVVNCLCCGKVYDFRLAGAGQLTNDLLRFLGESYPESSYDLLLPHQHVAVSTLTQHHDIAALPHAYKVPHICSMCIFR